MEPVEIGSHLELLFLVAGTILLAARVEAFRPFIQREGHVGDNYVELLQISVGIQMLGIGQGIAPGNVVGINMDTVDKKVHSGHGPRRSIHFLTVDCNLIQIARLTGGTNQQRSRAASGVVDGISCARTG